MICRPEQIISTRYSRNRQTASICSNDSRKDIVDERKKKTGGKHTRRLILPIQPSLISTPLRLELSISGYTSDIGPVSSITSYVQVVYNVHTALMVFLCPGFDFLSRPSWCISLLSLASIPTLCAKLTPVDTIDGGVTCFSATLMHIHLRVNRAMSIFKQDKDRKLFLWAFFPPPGHSKTKEIDCLTCSFIFNEVHLSKSFCPDNSQ